MIRLTGCTDCARTNVLLVPLRDCLHLCRDCMTVRYGAEVAAMMAQFEVAIT